MSLEELKKDEEEFAKFLGEAKRDRVKVTLAEAIAKLEKEITNLEIKMRKRALNAHSKGGEKRKRWSHDETKALLSCYLSRRDEFHCYRKKKFAYTNVLKDLIALDVLVTPTTPDGIQNKMKALWRAYKDAKIGNAVKAKCIEPFDKELNDIFGFAITMSKNCGDTDGVQEEESTIESFSSLYESDANNILEQNTAGYQTMNDVLECIDEKPTILWTPEENNVHITTAVAYKTLTKSVPSFTSTCSLAEKPAADKGYDDFQIDEKPSILWTADENLNAAGINKNKSSDCIAITNISNQKSAVDGLRNENVDTNDNPEERKKKYPITFKERAFKEKISFLKEKEENKMKRWEEKKEMLRLQTENRKREKQERFEEKLKLMKKLTEVIKLHS